VGSSPTPGTIMLKNSAGLSRHKRSTITKQRRASYEKFGKKQSILLKILGIILGFTTVVLGVNKATSDVIDKIGSNYWLAYSSIISGASLIIIVIILSKRSKRDK